MVAFPNCKINLGLNILNKREDAFHNLETIFYPISLKDSLEIITNPESTKQISFTQTGYLIDGDIADNLCAKAYYLLKKDFPQLPSIQMHLHKVIPIGAGLGGGSADGAFTLKLLNNKFNLNLSTNQLINYALILGSDCPFFILNTPCFATSRGEQLVPIALSLKNYQLVIVNPHIHINTGWAFTQLALQDSKYGETKNLYQAIQKPISQWKDCITNDFEQIVFHHHPLIKEIKETLYTLGAEYAAMSGTGSTVYGLFNNSVNFKSLFPDTYYTYSIIL